MGHIQVLSDSATLGNKDNHGPKSSATPDSHFTCLSLWYKAGSLSHMG